MSPVTKRRKLTNGDAAPSSPVNDTKATDISPVDTKEDAKEQRRSLFIRSLPASVTTERLTEHFSQSFPLKHATVVLDKATGISRGFGFVTFTDAEDAQSAVQAFNNSVLDGRKIKVEIAESRNREVGEDLATGRTKGSVNVKGQELRAERQKQQQEGQPPKLIVRNLPWSIKTSDDLAKLFLSYGKVKHAVVPKLAEKVKGGAQPQAGFGIVILRGKKNAENALKGVNGREVDGRVLAVDWAVDRETWEKLRDGQEATEQAHADDEDGGVNVNEDDDVNTSKALDDASDTSVVNEAEFGDAEMDDTDNDSEIHEVEEDDTADEESNAVATNTTDSNNTTIFIRNLPYTADDDALYEHFKTNFGPVRYARAVFDHETERPRGTAFVSFYSEDISRECVKNAPKHENAPVDKNDKKRRGEALAHSLLQNEMSDPSGKYTLEGRVLQVTRALPKLEADRRAEESSQKRSENKRHLYLLSEGTIPKGTKLYNLLGKAEIDIRESSSKQRQKMVKENGNLGLSLTRLSIRNVPRSLSSKELKALAREAIVGFAKDVKEGKRQPLNREELTRSGEEEKEAERIRKEKGKGMVKQVKIVFESEKTGGKVGETKGGRSRGYGFIEYYVHRHALMALRWMNGHSVKVKGAEGEERNKRLIVEFAIENAQVVQRRAEREMRAREGGFEKENDNRNDNRRDARSDSRSNSRGDNQRENRSGNRGNSRGDNRSNSRSDNRNSNKRKRDDDKSQSGATVRGTNNNKQLKPNTKATESAVDQDEKNKIAARNRIISQKRFKRKARKG